MIKRVHATLDRRFPKQTVAEMIASDRKMGRLTLPGGALILAGLSFLSPPASMFWAFVFAAMGAVGWNYVDEFSLGRRSYFSVGALFAISIFLFQMAIVGATVAPKPAAALSRSGGAAPNEPASLNDQSYERSYDWSLTLSKAALA